MKLAHIRVLHSEEEALLASKLAGLLFLSAALSGPALLVLPGVEVSNVGLVLGLSAVAGLWGLYCLALSGPERFGPLYWHLPAIYVMCAVAVIAACTGGATSPARFYLFFQLVYVAYFYPQRHAIPYLAGCVLIGLLPLAYDRGAVEGGYLAEAIVLTPAYVLLGMLIVKGKALLLKLTQEARSLSLRDPLTDLANRRALREWLQERMEREEPTGLVLIDLDGFKDVNTLHGYAEGDRVICETARTLQECVRSNDLVARLGGDEFAILVSSADSQELGALALRLLSAIRSLSAQLALERVSLSASVGWVTYPRNGVTTDDLIAGADFCLRHAKRSGKDRVVSGLERGPQVAEIGAVPPH
jgi:diguanylate cyclase (GGDEF)-like protein